MKNLFMFVVIIWLLSFPFFHACTSEDKGENHFVVIIKSFSGKISITEGDKALMPEAYLTLHPGTKVSMESNSEIYLYLSSGQKIKLTGSNNFSITGQGIVPQDEKTQLNFKQHLVPVSASIAGSRSLWKKNDIPPEVQKEIDAIHHNVSSSAMRALLKGECFKANNMFEEAASAFDEYTKLAHE